MAADRPVLPPPASPPPVADRSPLEPHEAPPGRDEAAPPVEAAHAPCAACARGQGCGST